MTKYNEDNRADNTVNFRVLLTVIISGKDSRVKKCIKLKLQVSNSNMVLLTQLWNIDVTLFLILKHSVDLWTYS